MNKVAVLFVSHIINDEIVARYEKLRHELPPNHELFWVFDAEGGNKEQAISFSNQIRFYYFNANMISSLGYVGITNTLQGSLNFVIQRFGLDYPEYGFYWIVEYDVVFTGNWHKLFAHIDTFDSDLVSTHIEHYNVNNQGWYWWHPVTWMNVSYPQWKRIKSFNPIFRLSSRALLFMDTFLRGGNSGHYEMLMATALYNHGYTLLDMGGYGDFTPKELINRFYVSDTGVNNGTMRYRPIYKKINIEGLGVKDKLFHPIK